MEGKILKKNIVILIGIVLVCSGIVLLMLSYFEPHVITPTEWNNQINQAEDVEPPLAERFSQFDAGDIVYIEGEVSFIEYLGNSTKKIIKISDSTQNGSFVLPRNYSHINVGDHVFLRVEIVDVGPAPSDDGFILSGNDPRYFKEKSELVDIEMDHFSFKWVYLVGGLFCIVFGSVFVFYSLKTARKDGDNPKENDSPNKKEE